jgi:hypothetical protein
MNYLLVGGRFGFDDGRTSSSYMGKLFRSLRKNIDTDDDVTMTNGGSWQDLLDIFETVTQYDVIFWFPDIPNDNQKLILSLKKKHQKCILITSKNNLGDEYPALYLIGKMLRVKSNLLLEFTKNDNGLFEGTVLDPLGNVFVSKTTDIDILAKTLFDRVDELTGFTRIPSARLGDAIEVPDKKEFFKLAKQYADRFHELVHAIDQDRFLGNISFRCEAGFPSFRHKDLIFVSKRNIDKRHIGTEGFVAVNPLSLDTVEYYGDHKPSIDTPTQLRLYDYYENINYMLHSHVYIKDAPFTEWVIPCGAVEETGEIIFVFKDWGLDFFRVNLKGHGSLILSSDVERLKDIDYVTRPMPEIYKDYKIKLR